MSAPAETPARINPAYAYLVVVVLALVYTFNFLDRQILSILQEQVRKDLHLSDTQLGVLTGLAFAIFYTGFGIPVAWLADRTRRTWVITAACALWSLFSMACGLATNFVQLLAARIGVGIGEAGGSPPSYSLISDYFPPERRATGLAIYSLGVPIGSALGTFAAGSIAAHYGWRTAFFLAGAPGLVLALVFIVLVREPRRGRLDPHHAGAPTAPLGEAVAFFFTRPTLLMTAISCGLSAFVGYAVLNWAPSFLIRVKGMKLEEVALYYALVSGAASAFGTFGSGWLVDRLARRNRAAYALLPATVYVVSLPFFLGFLWAGSWPLALAFLAVPSLVNNMYLSPAITVVQNAVPPGQRSLSGAILLFVLNFIGLGGGPLFVGMVSDHFKPQHGIASLTLALLALSPVILLTALCHLATAWSISRDAKRDAAR